MQTITLSPYTKTANSECGDLVYKASTDTDPAKDLFQSYGAVINNNIITFNNVEAIPLGQYTVTVTVSLSTAPLNDVFYSKTVLIEILDCEVTDLLVGEQAFGEDLTFEAT